MGGNLRSQGAILRTWNFLFPKAKQANVLQSKVLEFICLSAWVGRWEAAYEARFRAWLCWCMEKVVFWTLLLVKITLQYSEHLVNLSGEAWHRHSSFLVITARPYTLESDGDRSVCNLRACLTLQLAHLVIWQILLLRTWIGSPVLLITCVKCAERETNCSSAEIHAGGLITVQLELHLWKDVRDPETHTDVKERSAKNINASKSFFECVES